MYHVLAGTIVSFLKNEYKINSALKIISLVTVIGTVNVARKKKLEISFHSWLS